MTKKWDRKFKTAVVSYQCHVQNKRERLRESFRVIGAFFVGTALAAVIYWRYF